MGVLDISIGKHERVLKPEPEVDARHLQHPPYWSHTHNAPLRGIGFDSI